MEAVLDYVAEWKPKVVVLENVRGLLERHHETFVSVLSKLQKAHYQVTWDIMKTDEHGIPHSRSRIYII
eukprot:4251334-Lingulodinium_polyedra.AAC.1